MAKHVWIIEMKAEKGISWRPTDGAAVTKAFARSGLAWWKDTDPGGEYRIRKYVPDDKEV